MQARTYIFIKNVPFLTKIVKNRKSEIVKS